MNIIPKNNPQYRWVILVVFVTSQFVLSIAGYGWGPLAPFLKETLSLSRTQIGSIGSTFYFTAALSALPAGIIIDRKGVKKGLIAWLGLTGAPLLFLGAFKPSFTIFILMTAIAGLGYGMGNPVCSKGLLMWFDQNTRGTVFGIKQSAVTAGAAVSGILMVYLSQKMGPFNSLGVIGLVIALMVILSFYFYKDPTHVGNPSAYTTTQAATTIFAGFGELFANKPFLYLATIMGLLGLAQGIVVTFLVLYAGESLGYSPLAAGSLLTIVMLSGVVGRIFWGVVSDRLFDGRRRPVLIIISALAVLTVMMLALWGTTAWPRWLFIPVIIGLGLSSVGWNSIALVMVAEISTASKMATAVGLASTIGWLGLAAGPVAFGSITDHFGYVFAWMTLGIFCFFSLIFCLFLPVTKRITTSEDKK
ncbi:MAG: MFS transporter [Desulfosarcina sp.]|nr:MFS transporter [Desulfobacterales bacterium]